MRAARIVLVFLLTGASTAWAATVGGLITTNTTWTLANSPYIVTSNVTVSNNATLTIEPGVHVRFNAGTGLNIGSGSAGILIAQGTAAQPILFTSNSATPAPGQWNGIAFNVTTSASVLDYGIVEYGGAGANDNNIRVVSSTPTIQHSTIRNSDGYGIFVSGVNVRPALIGNTVSANGGYPLRLQLDSLPTSFSGNTFTANGIQMIELGGGSVTANQSLSNPGIPYAVTSSSTVYNTATLTVQPGVQLRFNVNTGLTISSGILIAQGTAAQPITFTSNSATPAPGQWNGVAFFVTTTASLMDYCVVEYGGAGGNDTDLYLSGSPSPTIQHSTIRNSDGAGVRMSNATPVIEHNTITSNAQGMVVTNGTAQETLQHNTIVGNTISGLVNSSPAGIVARLNWWGQASGPSWIGPGTGSAISGTVLFEPWLGQAPTDPFKWVTASNAPDPFGPPGGVTTFFGSLQQSANWTVTIKNSGGAVVRTLTGTGASVSQDWNGTTAGGATQPNGAYTFEMSATSIAGGLVAAPDVGSVTLNSALPIANLTTPTPDQMLAGGSIVISGTAGGIGFSSYKVEYAVGVSPTSWTLITSQTTPVTNGVLATWNAASLTSPVYTLRLTVTGAGGQTASDTVVMPLLNFFSLVDSPDPFSPNGDGTNETSTISVSATYPVNWMLTIKDSVNTVVRTYTGSGQRISQAWDGKNASGAFVADGLYTYQFQGTESGSGVTVTSSTGQVTLDRIAPTAAITSPTQNQTLLNDNPITFIGTASDANSWYWTLVYGVGASPAAFTTLVTSFTPVVNGTLYTLNPQGWAAGTYTFRLTVTDRGGLVSALTRQIVLDHIQVSAVSTNPSFVDPYAGEQAGINYTLGRTANVTVRIYDDLTKQLVGTLTATNQTAGAKTINWDGKNAGAQIAPLTAYYVTIEAVDPANANRKGTYGNAVNPAMGNTPSHGGYTVSPSSYDPYKNDLVQIGHTMTGPGHLSIFIWDATTTAIRQIQNQEVELAGAQTDTWDGRKDNGAVHTGRFNVFFDIPLPLPANPIVLRHTGAGFSDLRTEAYVIQPAFDEVSRISYTLAANANVTVTIVDPNGNTVRTLLASVAQTAGAQTVEWNGRTDGGQVVWLEGDYRVVLTGTQTPSGFQFSRTGVITVYR